MTGRQLLEALARGTEMHKAWEGGSGGSRRLVQVQCKCMLSCAAAIHGYDGLLWALRAPMPGDRLHHMKHCDCGLTPRPVCDITSTVGFDLAAGLDRLQRICLQQPRWWRLCCTADRAVWHNYIDGLLIHLE